MTTPRPLHTLTREQLEPAWSCLKIPTRRIAETLGVTRQALSAKAHSLGLPPRTKNREPQKKISDAKFAVLWLAGVRCKDIADAYGMTGRNSVSARAKHLGLPNRNELRGKGRGKGSWRTISLTEFLEVEYAARMAASAPGGKMPEQAQRITSVEVAARRAIVLDLSRQGLSLAAIATTLKLNLETVKSDLGFMRRDDRAAHQHKETHHAA